MEREGTFDDLPMIVTSYYDGPMEGLAESSRSDECFYFKMIAWDEGQDERLFVVRRMDSTFFERLKKLLGAGNSDSSNERIWVPEWKFRSAAEEQEANVIMESCTSSLSDTDFLVLGRGINSSNARSIKEIESIREDVLRKLKDKSPDRLDIWWPNLAQKK